jgi:GTPase
MDPENDEGNNEYKLKLLNLTEIRLKELTTQMRYRCSEEGNGECIYTIGVKDDGEMSGISDEELKETMLNLNKVAKNNNYVISTINKTKVTKNKNIYEFLIREKNNDKYIDIKICVAGNVDSGKSSLVGILTNDIKDDGRGLARSSIFNFIHELKTGRTSSISHNILGFDYNGNAVNNSSMKLSWTEIVNRSSKIISFFDLCGHEKYLKTTILGLSSSLPDICFILVSSNAGITNMTKEHIMLCISLKIPFIIIISKIDICKERQNVLEKTITEVNKILKHPILRRIPLTVKNADDILLSVKNIHTLSMTPIFHISSVTGEGINNLKTFLNLVSKKKVNYNVCDDNIEFHVDQIFSVNGFGNVLGGHLLSGKIKVGDKLFIGPFTNNNYEQIHIKSIYCKKTPLQSVSYGSYVCLGIKKIDIVNKIKKGNVVVSENNKLTVRKFTAKVTVLKSSTTSIKEGYEPIFNGNSIRTAVKILRIYDKINSRGIINNDDNILRSCDIATVDFVFLYKPQFIKKGLNFVISEGKCKISGEVLFTE